MFHLKKTVMVKLMKYAVGIDVSKDKFDVCFCEIDTVQQINIKSNERFSNTDKKFKEFDLWLGKNQKEKIPLILIMEATGVYYEKIALYLYKKGYSVSVVLPTKAKKYMQALGLKSKNDKIDAKGLARMAAEQRHDLWEYLKEMNERGKTIILTSHYLEEIQYLCRDIAIINHGRIVAEGTKEEFMAGGKTVEERYLEITREDNAKKV